MMDLSAPGPASEQARRLPPPLQSALSAVTTPEVIEAMKLLARHGLGVCMPHRHTTDSDFDTLPRGMVQVERNQQVTFEPTETLDRSKFIPVAWRYEIDNGVARIAECGCCHFDPVTQSHNRP